MWKNKLNSCILPLLILVLIAIPHIPFLGNYYVDVEPAYVDAGTRIASDGLDADLSGYYRIANPVFTSMILSVGYIAFGESPFVSRLILILLSAAFVMFLYFFLKRKLGSANAFLASLFVISNPMFIVYSQYVQADVPFMIFSSIALLVLFFAASYRDVIISSVMMGISLATKYVTVVLFPVVFAYFVMKTKVVERYSSKRLVSLVKFNIWYFIIAIALSLPVVLMVFFFQDSLVAEEVAGLLRIGMVFSHFMAYILWLGLFVGPFCILVILDLWKKMRKKSFIIMCCCLIFITLLISLVIPLSSINRQEGSYGEANLGWVESVVPSFYLSLIFFFVIIAAELMFVDLCYDFFYSNWKQARNLFFWIVIPILAMSLTRVANRYLLVVLVPLAVYMSFITRRLYSRKNRFFIIGMVVIHLIIFIAVGFFSNYYLHQRGLEALAAIA
jgi:4-amino-4-deoxy-L-arabinose transferase-like glycosyltransferase